MGFSMCEAKDCINHEHCWRSYQELKKAGRLTPSWQSVSDFSFSCAGYKYNGITLVPKQYKEGDPIVRRITVIDKNKSVSIIEDLTEQAEDLKDQRDPVEYFKARTFSLNEATNSNGKHFIFGWLEAFYQSDFGAAVGVEQEIQEIIVEELTGKNVYEKVGV
jgi:hypothetical protein